MQRSAAMVLVMSMSAKACALAEPAQPPGTVPIQARVKNLDNFPVELAVKTPTGLLPGAVTPASLPARGTAEVTFYLPISGKWEITVNGTLMFFQEDLGVRGCPGGIDHMEVSASGAGEIGCR